MREQAPRRGMKKWEVGWEHSSPPSRTPELAQSTQLQEAQQEGRQPVGEATALSDRGQPRKGEVITGEQPHDRGTGPLRH